MKYIRFNDSIIDTALFLQLQDLSTVLSGIPELEFEYNYGSFIDLIENKVTASHFWENGNKEVKEAGLKTDVLLRTIGTLHHTTIQSMKEYQDSIGESSLPKFAAQLFALLEDLRLEELVKKERPGTKKWFSVRGAYLKQYFESQLATNVTRSFALDELYCLIYLLLQSDRPDPIFPRANERQLEELEKLKPFIHAVFDATKTSDITRICEQIVFRVNDGYEDTMNEYFIFPIASVEKYKANTLFDELTRNDELLNDDTDDADEEKSEFIDEKFSTWHRENKNSESNSTFLQFELEQGTKTSLMGGGAREAEDADQALASIQGSSGESQQKEYNQQETLEKKQTNMGKSGEHPFGEENKDVVQVIKEAKVPTLTEEKRYREFVADIEPFKRKLSSTIEKTLENKKNAPRKDLVFGRLSKKLLPLVFEENPRVFYKKNQDSNEMDAVFTLLIDCSASMHNKMDETKRGVVLFHEVLKKLRIPHSIVGFWEDANEVREGYQPNYFHVIQSHSDSLYLNSGAKIMQLEPEEDNRDGYSIRVATMELEKRREKNRFLLVFSDGEPAASDYDQNGIVDTHLAVSEARKKGIEVIGLFLADGGIDESEEMTMKNIYGKERLMIPSVAELPEQFTPLLKKLLLKTI
ncbi:VWA domain-containing protein [Peribacillus frigoritolerans]|uniref:vWA domain-containing protein n=1 Tax=Peribacillus frigoritolerans TaxID=450367 RepID=UPI002B24C4B7|nr:VWA domain-containing protein [Peribacillus frigoritolerans]MEB2630037.1 VWA domain-containing protein [Peribacillus frigoritolerans]